MTGTDPDGYMSAREVADHLAGYARAIDAPVHTGVTVTSVAPTDDGYRVVTDGETWDAVSVVLANGGSGIANLPPVADGVPAGILSLSSKTYRSPDLLPAGGVLVVGASASGAQLADEIAASGREVTIAAGEHVRMPRSYRGRDIFWWMDAVGVLDERYDEIDDIIRARHVPSPQLIGSPDGRTVDLGSLRERGVRVTGRLGRIQDGVAQFSGGLANTVRLADLKLDRLLDRFDAWAAGGGCRCARRCRAARADRGRRRPRARTRPRGGRHRDDRLGDRLPARLLVARRSGARLQGPAAARRRRRHRSRRDST